jgi:hypothetical protein
VPPAVTTQADVGGLLRSQQAANQATIIQNTTCDNSYTCEYKNYVEWVRNQSELATTELPFLTGHNVDHYFMRVISCHAGCTNMLHRVHVGTDPEFLCSSPLVARRTSATNTESNYSNHLAGGTGGPGTDPDQGI